MGIEKNLQKLRASLNMTQEAFAEMTGVSRQAVQKWENGSARPDLDRIILIAKLFNVSVDALLLNSDKRIAEELVYDRKIRPEYASMHKWESYPDQLPVEFRQCMDEGKDIQLYQELFTAVSNLPAGAEREKIGDQVFNIVLNAPKRSSYPYQEPSDLDSIRELRPQNRYVPAGRIPKEDVLQNRVFGAWLGRICGCLLGKPIEGIRTDELNQLLSACGNRPLYRYLEESDITPELCNTLSFRLRGKAYADTVPCAPVDDDTNYTVLSWVLIDKYGRDFTPYDVTLVWLDYQPKNAYCTAERVAYRNFVAGYRPPYSAQYKNPYREWIGAQIRGDYYGYINPGNPEAAAEMAWRDACISHTGNGIYGEMVVAAMIAAAAVETDLEKIVEAGLGQIPEKSRLAEGIREILSKFRAGVSERDCFRYIHSRFDERNTYDWCHVISNAMIVTAALLWGSGNYSRSICMAVETGFDTDCNGASVGSVLGMRNGADCIGQQWRKPLNGMLETSIFGVGKVSIREMAVRTMAHMPWRGEESHEAE